MQISHKKNKTEQFKQRNWTMSMILSRKDKIFFTWLQTPLDLLNSRCLSAVFDLWPPGLVVGLAVLQQAVSDVVDLELLLVVDLLYLRVDGPGHHLNPPLGPELHVVPAHTNRQRQKHAHTISWKPHKLTLLLPTTKHLKQQQPISTQHLIVIIIY